MKVVSEIFNECLELLLIFMDLGGAFANSILSHTSQNLPPMLSDIGPCKIRGNSDG